MNSFDVFDTLIARRFMTSHSIWETIANEFNDSVFVTNRISADNGQRSLEEIYDAFGGLDAQMAREIELEINSAFPVTKNFEKVKDGDVLISDMYLPGYVIMQMLRNAGFDKQVVIYQSNGDKSNGKAWQKIKPDLHLGDNKHSDFDMPQKAGIQAIHYAGTHFTTNEKQLCDQGFPVLALLIREIRLRNEENEYSDIANQYNVPLLFCFAELVYRAKKEHPVVFLGRDCYLLGRLYNHYYHSATYAPFSRTLAYKNPHNAIDYLRTQTPPDALYVDLSSTGATWSHLSTLAQLNVLVGIYSDKYFYTPEKPVLPKGFNYLVSNSGVGDTNLILEAFNCADHGHIKDYDNYQATYGEPELMPDIIESIHAPIHQAVSLSCYYKEYLRSEMAKQTDQTLLRTFGNCAVLISHQENLLNRLSMWLSKENHYLGQL
jgi:hypothetical protein